MSVINENNKLGAECVAECKKLISGEGNELGTKTNTIMECAINFENFAVGDAVVFGVKSNKLMFGGATGKITKITDKLIWIVCVEEMRYKKADITDIKKTIEKKIETKIADEVNTTIIPAKMPKQTKLIIEKEEEVEESDIEEEESEVEEESDESEVEEEEEEKDSEDEDDKLLKVLLEKKAKKEQQKLQKEKEERWEEVKTDLITAEIKRQQQLMKKLCDKAGIAPMIYNLGVSTMDGDEQLLHECEEIVEKVKTEYHAEPKTAVKGQRGKFGYALKTKMGDKRIMSKVFHDGDRLMAVVNKKKFYAKYDADADLLIDEGDDTHYKNPRAFMNAVLTEENPSQVGNVNPWAVMKIWREEKWGSIKDLELIEE
jgi:hypothetical protein